MPACWMQRKQEDLDSRKKDNEHYRPRSSEKRDGGE